MKKKKITMMIPVQIKEEKYYSRFQLLDKFSCNYDKLDSILDKLNRNKIINIKNLFKKLQFCIFT